jgi:hypothetical protein
MTHGRTGTEVQRAATAKFHLNPPPGWQSSPGTAASLGAALLYAGPNQGAFAVNVNVMVQDFPDGLEKYMQITEGSLKKAGNILSQRELTLGGLRAREYIWKAVMNGKPLQFHSVFFLSDKHAYLFTGTSLESKGDSVSGDFARSAATFGPTGSP